MSQKSFIMIGLTIGSMAGSYLPMLFGVSTFSYTSVITGAIGGVIGTYIGYKLGEGL